jgi:hypothetical protein
MRNDEVGVRHTEVSNRTGKASSFGVFHICPGLEARTSWRVVANSFWAPRNTAPGRRGGKSWGRVKRREQQKVFWLVKRCKVGELACGTKPLGAGDYMCFSAPGQVPYSADARGFRMFIKREGVYVTVLQLRCIFLRHSRKLGSVSGDIKIQECMAGLELAKV